MGNDQKLSRKDFFKRFLVEMGSFFDEGFGDELKAIEESFPELIRPPGALPEQQFLEKCIKCGNCIKACPYNALLPVYQANEFDKNTPALRLGTAFCHFCPDFPCVAACPTGALAKKPTSRLHKIGRAEAIPRLCLRPQNISCEACKTICDRLSKAIAYDSENSPPAICSKACTGCGACLTVCPVAPAAALRLKVLT